MEEVAKYEGGAIEIMDPERVLGEAQKAAQALTKVISAKPKKVMIRGEQYLEFEDWMTVARFYGLTVRVDWSRPIEDGGVMGWEAKATTLTKDGREISAAEAMCLNDEDNWKNRPAFMLRSMAQTRACAKAFRTVLGFVPVLAGFKATPAEELDSLNGKEEKKETPKESEPKGKAHPGEYAGPLISVQERESEKTKKPYWAIKSQWGDHWTYDPGIAQMAVDAVKTDSQMVWELSAKGQITKLVVASVNK